MAQCILGPKRSSIAVWGLVACDNLTGKQYSVFNFSPASSLDTLQAYEWWTKDYHKHIAFKHSPLNWCFEKSCLYFSRVFQNCLPKHEKNNILKLNNIMLH